MFNNSSRKTAFTLVEVLASIVILGIGIVAALNGFAAISAGEARAQETEKLHRLALQKFGELRAITDTFSASESGDFNDQGEPDYVWELTVDPSGVDNLEAITVTVNKRDRTATSDPSASISSLVFQQPQNTQGATQ